MLKHRKSIDWLRPNFSMQIKICNPQIKCLTHLINILFLWHLLLFAAMRVWPIWLLHILEYICWVTDKCIDKFLLICILFALLLLLLSCFHCVWLCVTSWTIAYQASPWDSPGKNTGEGCHFALGTDIKSLNFHLEPSLYFLGS